MIHSNKSRQKIERINFFRKNDRQRYYYIVLYMRVCSTIVRNRVEQEWVKDKRDWTQSGVKRVVAVRITYF
jgi:hypothetical protein